MKRAPLSSRPRNRPARTGRKTRTAALLAGAASTLMLRRCTSWSRQSALSGQGGEVGSPAAVRADVVCIVWYPCIVCGEPHHR